MVLGLNEINSPKYTYNDSFFNDVFGRRPRFLGSLLSTIPDDSRRAPFDVFFVP